MSLIKKSKSQNEQFLWEVVYKCMSNLDAENLGRMLADYHTSFGGSEFEQLAKLKSQLNKACIAGFYRGYFSRKIEIRGNA